MNSALIVIFLIAFVLLAIVWGIAHGNHRKSSRMGRSDVRPKVSWPPASAVDRRVSSSEGFDTHVAGVERPLEPEPAATQLLGQPTAPMAWLVKMAGPAGGTEFRLGYVTRLGRSVTGNDIAIDDLKVSRYHAKIRLENERFVIHDFSLHGTFVNEVKIANNRRTLQNGDRIAIGAANFTFLEAR